MNARPLSTYHEDLGPVFWWRFPIAEPPYVGSPLDTDWPGYHTHWTPIEIPAAADDEATEGEWSADGRLTLTPAYYDNPERVYLALQLMGDAEATEAEVAGWQPEQRKAAAEWAISVHYHASDNDDVIVPPRPNFIRRPDDR